MGISLQHITLSFGNRTLLSDITTDIPSGMLSALLGRNGSGKSTLLRAISGLGSLQGGDIALENRPQKSLSSHEKATLVSIVTTDKIRISNLPAEDAVALGRAPYTNWIGRMQKADREIVAHALELVGMSSFAHKPMNTLSDGESQRVMIARALAQDTPIILLDEPTAFLDLPNRYLLASLLHRLAHEENKCILFSTHDLDIALNICDRIALIDSPHLHFDTPQQLVSEGHISRLFASDGVVFDPETKSIRTPHE